MLQLEAFAHRFMPLRDELAWKAATGKALTVRERATLRALNSVLDELEPSPAALSPEVQDILRDVLRT